MRPRELLGTARTPDGHEVTLAREAGGYVVRVGSAVLMSSRTHGSEEAMAHRACAEIRDRRGVRVLVGGLGMGFSLRAALDALGPDAEVIVAELLGAIVDWNREGPLADLARRPLEDPRAKVILADVADVLEEAPPASFDAILLDVDNGPEALTQAANARLYAPAALDRCASRLRAGGVLVVWSAADAPRFRRALAKAGLLVSVERVRARGSIARGSRHILFVGRRTADKHHP